MSLLSSMIDVGLGTASVCLLVAGMTPEPYSMWASCGALSGWILLMVGGHLEKSGGRA